MNCTCCWPQFSLEQVLHQGVHLLLWVCRHSTRAYAQQQIIKQSLVCQLRTCGDLRSVTLCAQTDERVGRGHLDPISGVHFRPKLSTPELPSCDGEQWGSVAGSMTSFEQVGVGANKYSIAKTLPCKPWFYLRQLTSTSLSMTVCFVSTWPTTAVLLAALLPCWSLWWPPDPADRLATWLLLVAPTAPSPAAAQAVWVAAPPPHCWSGSQCAACLVGGRLDGVSVGRLWLCCCRLRSECC